MSSTDISDIRNADGLDDGLRAVVDALLSVQGEVRDRNEKLLRYYEGDVEPASIGVDTMPESVRVDTHCDWPRKAVTSVSERSRFDGFALEGDQQDETLERVVRDSNLKGSYNRHVHSELIHGCMFATVGKAAGRSYVRFHTAETAAAIWDDEAGRIGSGLVVADCRRTAWSPKTAVPVQVNVHLPGRVVVLTRERPTRWVAEALPIPIERPAMEAFAFRPTGIKPFGSSRIDKTVMSLTDGVIRTLQNMAVSSALYAAPQKYILGLTSDQYETLAKNKWKAYIGNIFLAEGDEEGNSPSIGQLTPASPQPYIDELRTYATLFSGATGVPLNSLGIVQDNPSSAEAIAAAREDICIAAEDLNESNGESLRNVALMAMAVEADCSIEELSDAQRSVVARFMDPSMPSVVSQADAAVKIASVAPWVTESDVFLEMLGFDEAQMRRLAKARSRAAAQSRLAAALESVYSQEAGGGE